MVGTRMLRGCEDVVGVVWMLWGYEDDAVMRML